MKYVMFEGVFPILFDDPITHKEVADSINGEVTSAGFFSVDVIDGKLDVAVWGESISLGGVQSDLDDAKLLHRFLIRN